MKKKFVFFLIFITIFILAPINFSNAEDLSNRLSGKILLQVEDKGKAWYVDPVTKDRAYLGRPADAFKIMRELGLGISENDYNKFKNKSPQKFSGRIFLRVQSKGEAYYINPTDLKLYYLGRPADAFKAMRDLGLGIKNNDLNKITVMQKYNAESNSIIKISPTKTEEMVNPGDSLSRFIKVKNDSDSPKTLFAYLRDFKAGGETGIANLLLPGSEQGPYLSSWLGITNLGIEFAAGEEKIIDFVINVPVNAGPGGYYGAIVFGTEPPKINVGDEERGAAMSISQQAASLVLIQVRGEVNETANIREFSTNKHSYNKSSEINFLTRIENTGNVHINPAGIITIKNMLGSVVATIIFNHEESNILPQSIRRYEYSWQGSKEVGQYTASLVLNFSSAVNSTLTSQATFEVTP